MLKQISISTAVVTISLAGFAVSAESNAQRKGLKRIPVEFSGGHDTDRRDRGRPVALVAGALGVPAQVFRDAFSRVHPAPAGTEPEPSQVRANKDALLSALWKYGVTNDRLDEVSNYYRYVRSRGEIWPNQPAVANALVRNGVVVGIEVISGGNGYTSPPTITVPGAKESKVTMKLTYGADFDTNGSIKSISIVDKK